MSMQDTMGWHNYAEANARSIVFFMWLLSGVAPGSDGHSHRRSAVQLQRESTNNITTSGTNLGMTRHYQFELITGIVGPWALFLFCNTTFMGPWCFVNPHDVLYQPGQAYI